MEFLPDLPSHIQLNYYKKRRLGKVEHIPNKRILIIQEIDDKEEKIMLGVVYHNAGMDQETKSTVMQDDGDATTIRTTYNKEIDEIMHEVTIKFANLYMSFKKFVPQQLPRDS